MYVKCSFSIELMYVKIVCIIMLGNEVQEGQATKVSSDNNSKRLAVIKSNQLQPIIHDDDIPNTNSSFSQAITKTQADFDCSSYSSSSLHPIQYDECYKQPYGNYTELPVSYYSQQTQINYGEQSNGYFKQYNGQPNINYSQQPYNNYIESFVNYNDYNMQASNSHPNIND